LDFFNPTKIQKSESAGGVLSLLVSPLVQRLAIPLGHPLPVLFPIPIPLPPGESIAHTGAGAYHAPTDRALTMAT